MHILIAGMTESGKSTLGVALCRDFRRRRLLTAVLDPMHDDRFQADFKTDDLEKFSWFAWHNTGAFLFIDEAGSFGKFDAMLTKLLTRGRHMGHSIILMTQRPTQLDPLIRDQCRTAYLFALSSDAMAIFAREYNQPDLLRTGRLAPGQFFKVSRFSEISKFQLDFRTGKAHALPSSSPQ